MPVNEPPAHRSALDTWKANYDEHQAWRTQLGVIAHGVHRAIGDDQTVVLHVIATELDSIRLLLDAPDFQAAAKLDGVEGEPRIVLAKDVNRSRL